MCSGTTGGCVRHGGAGRGLDCGPAALVGLLGLLPQRALVPNRSWPSHYAPLEVSALAPYSFALVTIFGSQTPICCVNVFGYGCVSFLFGHLGFTITRSHIFSIFVLTYQGSPSLLSIGLWISYQFSVFSLSEVSPFLPRFSFGSMGLLSVLLLQDFVVGFPSFPGVSLSVYPT